MWPMKRRQLLTGTLAVALSSLIGIALGQTILRVAHAQDKSPAKRVAGFPDTVVRSSGSSCPTITGDTTLSLFAEDYSTNEGLSAARHRGVDSAKVSFKVDGIPAGTRIPLTLTFGIHYEQVAITEPSPRPGLSGSIAQSAVDVYLSGGGQNFLIKGDTLASRGGVTEHIGKPLPSGTISYTITVVNNQTVIILSTIQASAVTSSTSAQARSTIALDLLDVSFLASPPNSLNNVTSSGRSTASSYPACLDECTKLTQAIEARIKEIKNRYNKLLTDDDYHLWCHNFFFKLIINGESKGSYFGHIIQMEVKQLNLIHLCNEAGKNGCVIPQEAIEWAYKEVPWSPINPPCHFPGG